MFTGIVQAVGRILRTNPLEIDSAGLDLADVAVGDSICVQGVCLTATAIRPRGFTADVSEETLRVTSGLERPGAVNLEKSLALGGKIGQVHRTQLPADALGRVGGEIVHALDNGIVGQHQIAEHGNVINEAAGARMIG